MNLIRRSVFQALMRNPFVIIGLMLLCCLLSFYVEFFLFISVSYFLITIIAFWSSGWDLSSLALIGTVDAYSWVRGFLISIFMLVLFDVVVEPLVEGLVGKVTYSGYDHIRGDFGAFIRMLLIFTVLSAIISVITDIGYLTHNLTLALGGRGFSWLISSLVVSVISSITYFLNSWSFGVIMVLSQLFLRLVFYAEKGNLYTVMIVIFFYNIYAFSLIYLGKEKCLVDFFAYILAMRS